MIFGLDGGGAATAFPLSALRRDHVVNDRLGAEPVVIVHQPSSDTTTAFRSRAQGRTFTFRAADKQIKWMIDRETGSRWDPYGRCISGSMRGAQLESLTLEPEFWFAWSEFHPDTAVYRSTASR